MKQHKNKVSLIQSILSIIFGMIIWLVFLIGLNTPLSQLPDIIHYWSIIIAFSFSIPGAVMAILAKRNNVFEKRSIICISAFGIIISAIDILFSIMIIPIIVTSSLNINIISLYYAAAAFSITIVVDVILIVKYYQTKPIINVDK